MARRALRTRRADRYRASAPPAGQSFALARGPASFPAGEGETRPADTEPRETDAPRDKGDVAALGARLPCQRMTDPSSSNPIPRRRPRGDALPSVPSSGCSAGRQGCPGDGPPLVWSRWTRQGSPCASGLGGGGLPCPPQPARDGAPSRPPALRQYRPADPRRADHGRSRRARAEGQDQQTRAPSSTPGPR